MGEPASLVRMGELASLVRMGEPASLVRMGELASLVRMGELASLVRMGELASIVKMGKDHKTTGMYIIILLFSSSLLSLITLSFRCSIPTSSILFTSHSP